MADAKARFRIEGEDATAAAFRSALGNAQRTASGISSAFRGAFAGLGVSAVVGVARAAIETGDELQKAAIKAGIAGKQMSELAYAAKLSDVELGALSTSLRFMQKNLSEAASGGKTQKETLDALGLSISDLRDLKADEQFELLADRISQLRDPADRARAATEVFGKAGADLLPMFEQGAAGIRAARIEAEKFHMAFSDEQLAQLADADDAIKRMKASFDGLATTLTAKVAPAFSKWAQGEMLIIQAFTSGGSLVDKFKELARLRDEFLANQQKQEAYDEYRAAKGERGPGGRGGRPVAPGYVPPPPKASLPFDEFRVTAQKIGKGGPMAEFFDALDEETQTAAEREVATFRKKEAALEELRKEGRISQEVYQARMTELVEETLPEFKVNADKIGQSLGEMSVYAEQAMRGIQDSFYQFIRDPFEDGLKGLSVSILNTFKDTIAQIAATKLANAVVGQMDSKGNLTGGLLSTGINALFGGFMAEGGPLQQGKWYMAGEHGPEPIWGGGQGAFASGYGSKPSVVVNMTQNVDARGATPDAIKMLPAILDAHGKRVSDMTVARIREGLSRGRLA